MRFLAPLAILVLATPAHATTEVTECGQCVSGKAILGHDLDCSHYADYGHWPVLWLDGELDLSGYTLTANCHGIKCEGNCSVRSTVGQGRIIAGGESCLTTTGVGVDAAHYFLATSLRVSHVTISGFNWGLIGSWIDVLHSNIIGNYHGIQTYLSNVPGHPESRVRIVNSTVSHNLNKGIYNGQGGYSVVTLRNSEVSGNGLDGILGRSVKLRHSVVSGNGQDGIDAGSGSSDFDERLKVSVRASIIAGNGENGILARWREGQRRSVWLRQGSQVVGNGVRRERCYYFVCADVATDISPRTDDDVVCDTSYVINSGVPGASWSRCTLD